MASYSVSYTRGACNPYRFLTGSPWWQHFQDLACVFEFLPDCFLAPTLRGGGVLKEHVGPEASCLRSGLTGTLKWQDCIHFSLSLGKVYLKLKLLNYLQVDSRSRAAFAHWFLMLPFPRTTRAGSFPCPCLGLLPTPAQAKQAEAWRMQSAILPSRCRACSSAWWICFMC